MRVDGAAVERMADAPARPLVSACSCPTGSSSSRARPRCAGRTSTRSSPRCGRPAPARAAPTPRPWRSATRCCGASAPAAQPASLPAWDAELARHGVALRDDRARAVELLRERFAALAGGARPGRDGGARYRPRSHAPTRRGVRRRARRAAGRRSGARLHRPRPAPRRARRSSATGASCAPTARRASSGWRCWRCCSPSARCWPRSAARPPLLLLDDVMSELDRRAPRAAGRAARPRRAERRHHDRPRPRARRRRART